MSRWRQWDEKNGRPMEEMPGRVGLLGVATAGRKDTERLQTDWRYNVEQGTKALVLAWNRAPIIGNGRLDDGRNILECWYFALGRYGAGREGEAANAFAETVLDAVASGGEGRWRGVAVTRPSKVRLTSDWKNLLGPPAPWHFGDVAPRPPVRPVVALAMPYVHQTLDTPDDFRGGGSCGPSSMLMVLAFYKRLWNRLRCLYNGSWFLFRVPIAGRRSGSSSTALTVAALTVAALTVAALPDFAACRAARPLRLLLIY